MTGPAADAATAWAEVLDALERVLEHHRRVLNGVDPTDDDTFVPPTDLGPLPAALAPRAVALGAEYEAVLDQAEAQRTEVAHALQRLPRPRFDGPRELPALIVDFQS